MRGDGDRTEVAVADATDVSAWGIDDRHWEDPDRKPVPGKLMEKLRARMASHETAGHGKADA